MPIVSATKSTFEPAPAGIHQAIFQSIIDLGTHQPDNPTFKKGRKIYIAWELVHETYQTEHGPKRRKMGKEYTLSLGKKAGLRAMLDSARGTPFTDTELVKGFDLSTLIGRNVQLNVVRKAKASDPTQQVAVIQTVVPVGKGTTLAVLDEAGFTWDLPAQGPIVVPEGIPPWLVTKIHESDEWKAQEGVKDTSGVGSKATTDVPY